MKKRPAQAKFQSLGDILEKILKKKDIHITSEKRRLHDIWIKAVGSRIADQTSPEKLQKGTLFVKVSNSVWMQQLHFLKAEIIEKLKRQTGEQPINNISFSIGEVSPSVHRHRDPLSFLPATFPLKGSDARKIEKYTASVSDQELREILKRVMTKDIIRRKLSGNRRVP